MATETFTDSNWLFHVKLNPIDQAEHRIQSWVAVSRETGGDLEEVRHFLLPKGASRSSGSRQSPK